MMKPISVEWIAMLAVALSSLPALGQEDQVTQTLLYSPARVSFVDEAHRDEEFLDFRIQLVAAMKLKDVTWLVERLDPHVACGNFESGIPAFKRIWNLNTDPDKSKVWGKMLRAVNMGGVFKRDTFIAPYIHAKWPPEYDKNSFGLITGRGVNVRERARSNSRVIDKLTYSVVKMADDGEAKVMELIRNESYFWEKIILSTGQTAYVYGKYLLRPNDYHAEFRPIGDKWKLTAFLKGEIEEKKIPQPIDPLVQRFLE